MSGSGQKALPDVREWPGGPPGCQAAVWRPSRMSRSVQKALPNVREVHSDVREWSGVSLGYPGVVGRLPRMSESGRDALPDVWKWSGNPPGCPRVV